MAESPMIGRMGVPASGHGSHRLDRGDARSGPVRELPMESGQAAGGRRSMSPHLRGTGMGIDLDLLQDGVEEVGMMGGRFGGAVAALVAGRLGLPYLAMWDPVVRGKQYLRDLLRSEILSGIIENGEQDGGVHLGKIREALDSEGWT